MLGVLNFKAKSFVIAYYVCNTGGQGYSFLYTIIPVNCEE